MAIRRVLSFLYYTDDMSSVLLLNATFEPLGFVNWTRAITLVISGDGELIEQYEERTIRSAGGAEFPFPAVVRLLRMVTRRKGAGRGVPFSRRNLTMRDGGMCQVVGCESKGTTVDHIIPTSRGGITSWENCVLMCPSDNAKKGDRLLSEIGWKLKKKPKQPAFAVLLAERVEHRPEMKRWVTFT